MSQDISYDDLSTMARARLTEPERRVADRPQPFRATWWPESPSQAELFLTNFAVPSDQPAIAGEFEEEVAAISEALQMVQSENASSPAPANKEDPGAAVTSSLDRRAEAIALWEEMCYPVRRVGVRVYHITAPLDVLGTPLIRDMQIDDYISGASAYTSSAAVERAALVRHRNRWRVAAIVLAMAWVLAMAVL